VIGASFGLQRDVCNSAERASSAKAPIVTGAFYGCCEIRVRVQGHAQWWTVDAQSEDEALRLLPRYVAERTNVSRVSEVEIP
jgi:hypothetical protein